MTGPKSTAERSRAYRRRKGINARTLQPHGTRAAAERHRRAGEQPCPSCHKAEREYMRGRRPAPRTNKGESQ